MTGGRNGGDTDVPFRVFISYRNEDSAAQGKTWPLYEQLGLRFGEENVFFDKGKLLPGERWFQEIRVRAGAAGAFLALIGKRWLPSLDEHRRRGGPDYVARELDLAFQAKGAVTVIPVLVDGAGMPAADQLPPALRPLCECHAAELRHECLPGDIRALAELLEGMRTGSERASAKAPAGGDRRAQGERLAQAVFGTPPPPAPASLGGHSEQPLASPRLAPLRVASPAPAPAEGLGEADDYHYRTLAGKLGNLVVFLGADANADDRQGPFQVGKTLPDDRDLAEHIASQAGLGPCEDLAEVAQYARAMQGEGEVFAWMRELLRVDVKPGHAHDYLARLPGRLEELDLGRRYQMIVTPKYDAALERAFREQDEPFDVAVYVRAQRGMRGHFVHLPWEGGEHEIETPGDYDGFPCERDTNRLMRTIIVRVSGLVEERRGFPWEENYVVTEDHYIDYLRGGSAEQVLPGQIFEKLRTASYLFLGYRIADWRLRMFLHWIFGGPHLGSAKYWAVQRRPRALEQELWSVYGLSKLFQESLTDYLEGFASFLAGAPVPG
ncbi:MAG TPA: SIR2 family protein [Solirubrobacteraceae bacterium]|nr:SIR2 family protein [Solirubrobacteraceae bacterium]